MPVTYLPPFGSHFQTCCGPELSDSLEVKAPATNDSPLLVIPLEARSSTAREGRAGRADTRCWMPESPG